MTILQSYKYNKRNCLIWSSEWPLHVNKVLPSYAFVMTWCTFSRQKILRLFCFHAEKVTRQSYKTIFRYYVFPQLCTYFKSLIFYQYDPFPRHATLVRQEIDRKYLERRIGRADSTPCPSRSLDLTSCKCLYKDISNVTCFISLMQT